MDLIALCESVKKHNDVELLHFSESFIQLHPGTIDKVVKELTEKAIIVKALGEEFTECEKLLYEILKISW